MRISSKMQVDRHTNTYQFFTYCVKCGKKGEIVLPEKRALEIAQMKCSCELPLIPLVGIPKEAPKAVREIVIPKPVKTTYTPEKKHFDKKTVTSTIRKKR